MGSPDKGFSLSTTPTKSSSIHKPSASDAEGLNGTDQNYCQMRSKLQKPKKETTKNFMSPTISEVSKAALPRKKILAERNEASGSILSDTHLSQTPDQDTKSVSADAGVVGSGDEDQNTCLPDSSSSPYDPLTNYLSPRPKFLRYKPNRRREIILLREKQNKEGQDGLSISRSVSFDSQNASDEDGAARLHSLGFPSEGGSVKREDEDVDGDEEEIEEMEQESSWSLKDALHSLLVFVLLVLSTLYISSMNSPSPSPTMQAIEGFKEEFLKIQSYALGASSVKGFEGGLAQAKEGVKDGYLKILSLMFEGTTVRSSERGSEFMEQQEDRKMGLIEVDRGAIDKEFEEEKMAGEENGGGVAEETDELDEVLEVQDGENEYVCDQEKMVSDQVAENSEIQGKFGAFQDDSEKEENVDCIRDEQVEDEKLVELVEYNSDEGAGNEEMIADEIEGVEKQEITNKTGDDIIISERLDKENTKTGISNLKPELNLEEVIEPMETESIPKVVIWASVFVIIMAPLMLGLHLRREKTPKNNSSLIVNQWSEPVIAEKSRSEVITRIEEDENHIEKVESYPIYHPPSSSIHSVDEAFPQSYQSRAPTVDLLGEFVLGGEVSNGPPEIYAMKSRMMEGKESNKFSVSQEKGSQSNTPLRTQATLSAHSTMDSPSYGSFTAKKTIMKEEGRDEEVRKVATTPVRRSSRIRNRAIMSP